MSDNTEDVRTKIPPEEYNFLRAWALGEGEEVSVLARRIILDRLSTERRKHRLIADAIKSEVSVGHTGAYGGKST